MTLRMALVDTFTISWSHLGFRGNSCMILTSCFLLKTITIGFQGRCFYFPFSTDLLIKRAARKGLLKLGDMSGL